MPSLIKKIIKSKKGGTLLMVTYVILMTILAVSLSTAEIVQIGIRLSRERYDSTRAYFAAEAGAEQVLFDIRESNIDPPGMGCLDAGDNFCFDSDSQGAIDSANCASGCLSACSNCGLFQTTALPNEAYYEIIYSFAAPTTTLESIGRFRSTGRKIELQY